MNSSELVLLSFLILLQKAPGEGSYNGDSPTDLGSDVLGRGHSISFLTPNNTRVVAHHGSTVRLPCRVHKPPNSAMVTWTRRLGGDTGGIQLLSVGDYTHVQDNRFRVEKKPHDANWELVLARVEVGDGGDYLCQTSSHPPQHITTSLAIVDAFSEIQVENVGENAPRNKKYEQQDEKNSNQKEIFIKKGSQLKLKCELKKATEKPKFIFWYHNQTMINYTPQTGKNVILDENGWSSVLLISSVASGDGGNYTCAPQNLVSDTVLVTIMEGDGTFAAVHEDTLASGAGQATLGPGLLLLMLAVYRLNQY